MFVSQWEIISFRVLVVSASCLVCMAQDRRMCLCNVTPLYFVPAVHRLLVQYNIKLLYRESVEECKERGSKKKQQEAHGPQLAHLSETATADMQMACNIFPILLWQGNGLNSFWNILLTRLKCWNFQNVTSKTSHPQCLLLTFESNGISVQQNKWKIDFQDGGHLGFPIGAIIAIFDLQVTRMLPTKFRVNWLLGLGEEAKNRFSRRLSWRISNWHDFSYFWSTSHPAAS